MNIIFADSPKKSLRTSVLSIVGAVALVGCSAIERVDNSERQADMNAQQASTHLLEMQNRSALLETRTPLREMSSLWVDTTPLPLNGQSLGSPETVLDCKMTFNPKVPVSLNEFARIATNLCGLSIQITTDANTVMSGGSMGAAQPRGRGGQAGGQANTGGALPSPFVGGSADFSGSFSDVTGMISGISWVNKPLSGLLDLVTNRLGLGWKFQNNTVTIFYIDTQVFHLYAISGKTTMETTVKSGVQKSSSSGAESSTFSSDGSVQETGVKFETDIIADIEKTLQTMITPDLGRLSVSASTGTVAVTDRPDVLRRVGEYLAAENKRITRQVVLNVKVLSVQVSDGDALGVNWNAVYQTLDASYGLGTGFTSVPGGVTGNVGIINAGKRWNGSDAMVQALSQQGRVSTLSSPSVTTLNMKPAPILVGTQTTYLAEVSTTAIEGGSSQQALTPGVITTGFNMTLLPYLMQGNDMLLQYSINLSSLTGMKTAESGENRIEMPEVDNRIFSQSVRLRSGQTLVLSGFDQSTINTQKEGIGSPSMWLLGGRGEQGKKRDVLVVLITPVITD